MSYETPLMAQHQADGAEKGVVLGKFADLDAGPNEFANVTTLDQGPLS
jgi:hypothetical protein